MSGSKKASIEKLHHSGFASADDAPADHQDLDKGNSDDGNNSENGGKPKRTAGKRDTQTVDGRKDAPSGKEKCQQGKKHAQKSRKIETDSE